MMGLNNENAHLKNELTLLRSASPLETEKEEQVLSQHLQKKRWMVIGEGSVFVLLLLLGSLRIRESFIREREAFIRESEVAKQQKNFLLSVTHELKSPLASTRLQLETLLLRTVPAATQKTLLQQALQDNERLQALVENILIATQIDKNNFVVHRVNKNISAYLQALLGQPGLVKDHELVVNIDPDIWMLIDTVHFASIALNLIENSKKYSPKGSTISFVLRKKGQKIEMSVADQGIGIAAHEKKKIFEKFYRVGEEQTRNTKGTGLGLFIVKYLTEQHECTIFVEDNQPTGSIFKIEFKAT